MRPIDAAPEDKGSWAFMSGRWFLTATRRLGAVAVAVLCLGAASVPNAQVASAGLLGASSTVRVIKHLERVGVERVGVERVGVERVGVERLGVGVTL